MRLTKPTVKPLLHVINEQHDLPGNYNTNKNFHPFLFLVYAISFKIFIKKK